MSDQSTIAPSSQQESPEERKRRFARERKRRYLRRKKIEKYGEQFADTPMSGKHGRHARGENSPRWNKGTILSSHGYVLIRVPKDHHRAFGPPKLSYGYAYEHDLVMEAAIGRPLAENEEVHHVDENKQNNAIDNLELKTKSAHAIIHNKTRERDLTGRFAGKKDKDLRVRQYPKASV